MILRRLEGAGPSRLDHGSLIEHGPLLFTFLASVREKMDKQMGSYDSCASLSCVAPRFVLRP